MKTTIRLDVPVPGSRIVQAVADATSLRFSDKLRMRSYPLQKVEPFVAPGVEPLVEQSVIAHIEARGWNGKWSKTGDLQIRTTGLQIGGKYNKVCMYIISSKKPEKQQRFGGFFYGLFGGIKLSPVQLMEMIEEKFFEQLTGLKHAR